MVSISISIQVGVIALCVVRYAQLEVDQVRSVAFIEPALQFARVTYIGADPNNASRACILQLLHYALLRL